MPSPCTVCLHPDRAEVDRLLASGRVKIATLARRLNVGRKALERHRDRHVPASLAKLHAHAEAESASSLLAQFERMYLLTLAALAEAEGATLSHIDPDRVRPAASHAAIAGCVNQARRHLGDIAELFDRAAEAAQLVEPPDPELEARIQVTVRSAPRPQHTPGGIPSRLLDRQRRVHARCVVARKVAPARG